MANELLIGKRREVLCKEVLCIGKGLLAAFVIQGFPLGNMHPNRIFLYFKLESAQFEDPARHMILQPIDFLQTQFAIHTIIAQ